MMTNQEEVLQGENQEKPSAITFCVEGMNPAPQGSKKSLGNGIMIESCKNLKPWRNLVSCAAVESKAILMRGPVKMSVVFLFTRPSSHFKRDGTLKILEPSITSATHNRAPVYHAIKPDISKLLRSTEDALSKLLYEDDCRICGTTGDKRWTVGNERPGAIITIIPLS